MPNEDAIKDGHKYFVSTGYKGNIGEYKKLLETNKNAVKDTREYFESTGYKGTTDDFNELFGLKKKVESQPTSQKETTESVTKEKTKPTGSSEPSSLKEYSYIDSSGKEISLGTLGSTPTPEVDESVSLAFEEEAQKDEPPTTPEAEVIEGTTYSQEDYDLPMVAEQQALAEKKEEEERYEKEREKRKVELQQETGVEKLVDLQWDGIEYNLDPHQFAAQMDSLYGDRGIKVDVKGDKVIFNSKYDEREGLTIDFSPEQSDFDWTDIVFPIKGVLKGAGDLFDSLEGSGDEYAQSQIRAIEDFILDKNISPDEATTKRDIMKSNAAIYSPEYYKEWTEELNNNIESVAQEQNSIIEQVNKLDLLIKTQGTPATVEQRKVYNTLVDTYEKNQQEVRDNRLLQQEINLASGISVKKNFKIQEGLGTTSGALGKKLLSGLENIASGGYTILEAAMGTLDEGTAAMLRELFEGDPEALKIINKTYKEKDLSRKERVEEVRKFFEGSLQEAAGVQTTDAYPKSEKRGLVMQAAMGVLESLPAMALTAVSGGIGTTAMGLQAFDAVAEEWVNNPDYKEMPLRDLLVVGGAIGTIQALLEKAGLSALVSKTPLGKSTTTKILQAAFQKAGKNPTKEAFNKLVAAETNNLLVNGTVRIVGGTLVEGETGALQELADLSIKKVYNTTQGKEVFQMPEGGWLKQIGEGALLEAIGGSLMSGAMTSTQMVNDGIRSVGMNKEITELLHFMSDSPDLRQNMVKTLKMQILKGRMTKPQAQETMQSFEEMVGVMNEIPSSINKKGEAFDLIIEKNNIEKKIAGKSEELTKPQRERITKINEELEILSTEPVEEVAVEPVEEVAVEPVEEVVSEEAKSIVSNFLSSEEKLSQSTTTTLEKGEFKDKVIESEEFNEYFKEGTLTDERIKSISEKVVNNEKLSARETYILKNSTNKIEEGVKDSLKETPVVEEAPVTETEVTEEVVEEAPVTEVTEQVITEEAPLTEITGEEFEQFVNDGTVSEERITSIATKIKDGQELSEQEQSIREEKATEIEEILIKTQEDAVPIKSTEEVDVQESTRVSPTMGEGDTEVDVVTEQETTEEADQVEVGETAEAEVKETIKKKTVAKRVLESQNTPDIVKEKLEKLNINYNVEKQDQAIADAELIIKEIGLRDAYESTKNGLIRGGRGTTIVFRMAEELTNEINEAILKDDMVMVENLSDELAEVYEIDATESLRKGQETAIRQKLLKTSLIKFTLPSAKQEWKKEFNKKLTPAQEKTFESLSQKIRVLNEKLKLEEEKRGKVEEKVIVSNIMEAVAREKAKINKSVKINKTEQVKGIINKLDSLEKKILSKSYSDVTFVMTTMVAGIKAIKTSIKTYAKTVDVIQESKIKEIIKKGIQNIKNKLSKRGEKLPKEEAFQKDLESVFITKQQDDIVEGEIEQYAISIPKETLYNVVREGADNITDITNGVYDKIKNEYPNLTKKEVKEALINYGKQVNPTKQEIKETIKSFQEQSKELNRLSKKKFSLEDTQKLNEVIDSVAKEDDLNIKRDYSKPLELYKKRLTKKINDYKKAIETKEAIKKRKPSIKLDEEALNLKKELKKTQEEYKLIFEKTKGSNEVKIDEVISRKRNLLNNLETKRDYLKKTGKQIITNKPKDYSSAEVSKLNKQIKETRDEYNDLLKDLGVSEAQKTKQVLQNIKKREEQYKAKLKARDFSKKKRKTFSSDAVVAKAKRELLKAKDEFTEEFKREELKQRANIIKALDVAFEIINVPKGLLASFDLSAAGRQGAFLALGNPKEYGRAFVRMHKAISNEGYENFMADLENSEYYPLLVNMGLSITDTSGDINTSEEIFLSRWTKTKIKIKGKNINFAEMGLSASERAYSTFLNSLRADMAIKGIKMFQDRDITFENDPKAYKDLADFINNATGRGKLPFDSPSLNKVLNAIFFSPKMIAGNLNLFKQLVPGNNTNKYVKGLILKNLLFFVGYQALMKILMGVAIGAINNLLGDEEEEVELFNLNLTDTDFNKIRWGDTRYDTSAGLGILMRTAARFATQKKGDKDIDGFTEVGRFFFNKLSPGARLAYNVYSGNHPTDIYGDKKDATVLDYFEAVAIPLTISGTLEDLGVLGDNEQPPAKTFFNFVFNTYGINSQTYQTTKKGSKKRQQKSTRATRATRATR